MFVGPLEARKITFVVSYIKSWLRAYEGVCRFACIFGGIFVDFHDNVQTGAEPSLLTV